MEKQVVADYMCLFVNIVLLSVLLYMILTDILIPKFNNYKSTIVSKFYKDLYWDSGLRIDTNGQVEYYSEGTWFYRYKNTYCSATLSEQEAHDYFEDPLKPTKTELMLFKLGYDISEENFEAIFGYYLSENKFKYIIKRIIKDFKERKNHGI